MDSEVFCERKRHFFSDVKSTPQENMLLILDGHVSLTPSLAAIESAPKHGVVLPQHASNAACKCQFLQAIEYISGLENRD
jgi:hypothetical protein